MIKVFVQRAAFHVVAMQRLFQIWHRNAQSFAAHIGHVCLLHAAARHEAPRAEHAVLVNVVKACIDPAWCGVMGRLLRSNIWRLPRLVEQGHNVQRHIGETHKINCDALVRNTLRSLTEELLVDSKMTGPCRYNNYRSAGASQVAIDMQVVVLVQREIDRLEDVSLVCIC